ncbi:hypothetical protein AOLI_G00248720 [Acnodon oligacanthus]
MAAQLDIQSKRAFITAAASTAVSALHMLPPEGVNLFVMTSHHRGVNLHHLGGLAILLISVSPSMTIVLPKFEDLTTLFLIIMTHCQCSGYWENFSPPRHRHDSSDPYEYVRTDLTHHAIDTGDAKPIKLRPYCTFPGTQVLLQQEVDKLLEHDHKPLVGLKKLPLDQDPTGRHACWAIELDLHDWTVVHHDGTKHLNADSVSRHPHNTSSDVHIRSIPDKPPMATTATQTGSDATLDAYASSLRMRLRKAYESATAFRERPKKRQ